MYIYIYMHSIYIYIYTHQKFDPFAPTPPRLNTRRPKSCKQPTYARNTRGELAQNVRNLQKNLHVYLHTRITLERIYTVSASTKVFLCVRRPRTPCARALVRKGTSPPVDAKTWSSFRHNPRLSVCPLGLLTSCGLCHLATLPYSLGPALPKTVSLPHWAPD